MPVPVTVEFGLVPVRSGTSIYNRDRDKFFILFFMLDYKFYMFCFHCYLYHMLLSSSLTVSRAPLQFPDCITCSHPVRWMDHVLPFSSLAGGS